MPDMLQTKSQLRYHQTDSSAPRRLTVDGIITCFTDPVAVTSKGLGDQLSLSHLSELLFPLNTDPLVRKLAGGSKTALYKKRLSADY